MFTDIKEDITRKFRDLFMWVSNIADDDENDFSKIERGLFFVYAYGLYEEIVRITIVRTISELNSMNIHIRDCSYKLYSLIFSPEYDSMYSISSERKWQKRWEISSKFNDNPTLQISNELFPTDGKNLRYRQLESLANSFGIKSDILPSREVGGYLNELVNHRNNIAHGNKLPKEIGRGFTNQDLKDRCRIIEQICTHVVNIYEQYITEREYLLIQSTPNSSE